MLHDLMGDEAFDLIRALEEPPVTSVRLNRRKPGAVFQNTDKVAWCDSGLYLKERPEFILDPLLHAGAYYVQDASSMIYETVITKILEDSPLFAVNQSKLKILDLCAAPGGKTTAIINALQDGAEIIANEYSNKRVGALKENLAKWGYPFVKVTNKDSYYYSLQKESFDIIAVDAPCSGEGMMRKEEMARTQWSNNLVNECVALQKEILNNSVKALKPGGYLIFSTCTFNRFENEENAQYITDHLHLLPIEINLPEEWGIPRGYATDLPVYRFMPHKTKGEGLFLAIFKKPGDWKPSDRKTSIPSFIEDKPYPKVEVDKSTALAYLRRESIKLPEDAPKGFVTITYKNLPLGPAKNIGIRANNLYPKNWRILKR